MVVHDGHLVVDCRHGLATLTIVSTGTHWCLLVDGHQAVGNQRWPVLPDRSGTSHGFTATNAKVANQVFLFQNNLRCLSLMRIIQSI